MLKKLLEVFHRYTAAIKKYGEKFDFYKMAKPLEKALSEVGLNMKANEYFGKLFEVLDDPKLKTDIDWDTGLKTFVSILPPEWKKQRFTDEMVIRYVPQTEWPSVRDSSWVQKHKEAQTFKDLATAEVKVQMDLVKSDDLATSHYAVTVNAGDLSYLLSELTDRKKLQEQFEGESVDDLIADALDSTFHDMEKKINKTVVEKSLHNWSNIESITVDLVSSPNPSELKNAKFEFEVTITYWPDTELTVEIEKLLIDFFSGKSLDTVWL